MIRRFFASLLNRWHHLTGRKTYQLGVDIGRDGVTHWTRGEFDYKTHQIRIIDWGKYPCQMPPKRGFPDLNREARL